jgi:hypothetical protein
VAFFRKQPVLIFEKEFNKPRYIGDSKVSTILPTKLSKF